jgi:polysaccharide deacetylase 2 family uncharacterized protein YibQ
MSALLILLPAMPVYSAQIAIIIDDVGNNHHRDAAVLTLPINIAISILPHKQLSQKYALLAHEQHREYLLHMPMESMAGIKQESNVLLASMSDKTIVQKLNAAFASVPNALGMNNHMGSRLTQLEMPMRTTMDYLHRHGLIFVDSRTTALTQAEAIAKQNNVPALRRHVFLDNDLAEDKIARQFNLLVRKARKYGRSIAIGHPHMQTIAYLQKRLPTLAQENVQLVPLSAMLAPQLDNANASILASSAKSLH